MCANTPFEENIAKFTHEQAALAYANDILNLPEMKKNWDRESHFGVTTYTTQSYFTSVESDKFKLTSIAPCMGIKRALELLGPYFSPYVKGYYLVINISSLLEIFDKLPAEVRAKYHQSRLVGLKMAEQFAIEDLQGAEKEFALAKKHVEYCTLVHNDVLLRIEEENPEKKIQSEKSMVNQQIPCAARISSVFNEEIERVLDIGAALEYANDTLNIPEQERWKMEIQESVIESTSRLSPKTISSIVSNKISLVDISNYSPDGESRLVKMNIPVLWAVFKQLPLEVREKYKQSKQIGLKRAEQLASQNLQHAIKIFEREKSWLASYTLKLENVRGKLTEERSGIKNSAKC